MGVWVLPLDLWRSQACTSSSRLHSLELIPWMPLKFSPIPWMPLNGFEGIFVCLWHVGSSAAEFNSRGTCCSSKASKSFLSFLTWMRYAASWGLLQLQSPRTCLMISWESPSPEAAGSPETGLVLGQSQSFILCHVVGGLELKVHHVPQLISVWVDEDHTSSSPLLADGSVEEECPVGLGEDWCPDFRLRRSGLWSGPTELLGEGIHSAMKSVRI